ncbi:carboxypeptidase-like regulatory domain-containing protein [Archangium primigenium]|uniref:carboxypeptidase-like regulatory domain-containing protein n=1 Tax=[Archangium] primigenium TaxID=2792470 RepID=UPI00195B7B20|nr:carboxypeptidase-like regulatory domain-containing protein [Archangium primigenium]MBM7117392.1 carboxypeptidase regulatory-like domain-containing protein [Archangium primigenium]
MRLRQGMIAALVGALLVAGLLLWRTSDSTTDVPPPRASPPSVSATSYRRVPLAAPVPEGPFIAGTVRGERGPVAGAVVYAVRPSSEGSLMAPSCRDEFGRTRPEPFLECAGTERLLAWMRERDGEAQVLAQATSASDGSFLLQGMEAGAYTLWAESPEGVALRRGASTGEQGVDLVLLAGTRLSGRVTDRKDVPVADALVTAVFAAQGHFLETRTDARGQYALGPLPRGEYLLLATHGDACSRLETERLHGASSTVDFVLHAPWTLKGRVVADGEPASGVRVELRGVETPEARETLSDERGHFSFDALTFDASYELSARQGALGAWLDVSANESSEVLLELRPRVELEGVVRDARGRPVEGARVEASQESDFRTSRLTTRTDARGHYLLGPLAEGEVDLHAFSLDERENAEHQAKFSAGRRTVDLVLRRLALVEGALVDDQGAPIVGEHVALLDPEIEDEVDTALSGPEGHFLLVAPEAGVFVFRVGSSQRELLRREVRAPTTLNPRLSRSPRVQGLLVDERGQPVTRARVGLWPLDAGNVIESGETDDEGHFSLAAPRPGRYGVSAELASATDYSHFTSTEVEVHETGGQVRLQFQAGHPFSGRVVNTRGEPLEKVDVTIRPHGSVGGYGAPELRTQTLADGRFSFGEVSGEHLVLMLAKRSYVLVDPPPPPPPSYRMIIHGQLDEWQRVDPPASARTMHIVMARRAYLRAKFVRADGSPIPYFSVNGEPMDQDREGYFWMPIEQTGPLTLTLSAASSVPGSAPLVRTVVVQREVDLNLGTLTLEE